MDMPKKKKKRVELWKRPLRDKEIPSDVLGSYTGAAADGGAPVQDADDL